MDTFKAVEAALDFAIEREQEAVDFYLDLAKKTPHISLQKTLRAFAGVEKGHKEKLQAVKLDEAVVSEENSVVVDLKISDYLVEVEPSSEMSFQDALIVAMKREKAAMELYADLAGVVNDKGLKSLFTKLAREEATHKVSFETAYETHFLSEN